MVTQAINVPTLNGEQAFLLQNLREMIETLDDSGAELYGCKLAADYRVVSVCVRPADVTLAASEPGRRSTTRCAS